MAFKMKGYNYPGKSPMKQGVKKPNWDETRERVGGIRKPNNRQEKIINKNNPDGGGINLDDYNKKRKTPYKQSVIAKSMSKDEEIKAHNIFHDKRRAKDKTSADKLREKTPMKKASKKASPPQKKSFLRDLKEAIKDFPEAMKQGPIKHAKQIASDIKSKIKGKKKK